MDAISKIKHNPYLKRKALWMLIPANEARPRWWVKVFLNPFYHKKGQGAVIKSSVRKDLLPFNSFNLGEHSVIEDYSVINNGMGEVRIGDNSFIGLFNTVIGPVQIGSKVIIAQNVVISGLNHGYEDVNVPIKDQPCVTRKITIEDDCWIGSNTVITAGVTIGRHAVVAAGSVVTKPVPPYCVAAGNPARIIKRYNFNLNQWEKVQS